MLAYDACTACAMCRASVAPYGCLGGTCANRRHGRSWRRERRPHAAAARRLAPSVDDAVARAPEKLAKGAADIQLARHRDLFIDFCDDDYLRLLTVSFFFAISIHGWNGSSIYW